MRPEKKYANVIGLDLETSGLNPALDKILLITLYNAQKDTYITIKGDYIESNRTLLTKILQDPYNLIIGHNLKFDYSFLRLFNIEILSDTYCTLTAERVLNGGRNTNCSLDFILDKYLSVKLDKKIRKSFINKTDFNFTEEQLLYAKEDVKYLGKLRDIQLKLITKYNLSKCVELENRCLKIFADIELNGIPIDKQYWQENIINYYTLNLDLIETKLNDLCIRSSDKYLNKYKTLDLFSKDIVYLSVQGSRVKNSKIANINWNSHQDILDFFKEVYNVSLLDKHKKPSTSTETLLEISGLFKEIYVHSFEEQLEYIHAIKTPSCSNIAAMLIMFKKVSKLLGTFGVSLLNRIENNRIHPSLNPLGTNTGRITCTNPNIQQMPGIDRFRRGFRASEGYYILGADYSAAELRIIANFSGDETMITSFRQKEDVHSKMASILHNKEVSKSINPHLRTTQKVVNFGLAYGMGVHSLSTHFNGDLKKAQEFLDKYFGAFPKIGLFLDNLGKSGVESLSSRTFSPINRVRWFDFAHVKRISGDTLQKIKRQSKNHPIQGTCADIVKIALLLLDEWIKKEQLDIRIIMQIHDEILLEISDKIDKSYAEEKVRELMLLAGSYIITELDMEVDIHINNCWTK